MPMKRSEIKFYSAVALMVVVIITIYQFTKPSPLQDVAEAEVEGEVEVEGEGEGKDIKGPASNSLKTKLASTRRVIGDRQKSGGLIKPPVEAIKCPAPLILRNGAKGWACYEKTPEVVPEVVPEAPKTDPGRACQVSAWSAWDKGKRTRTVTQTPISGTIKYTCPVLVETRDYADCQVGSWGAWKDCVSCGIGNNQERKRSTTTARAGNGKVCPILLERRFVDFGGVETAAEKTAKQAANRAIYDANLKKLKDAEAAKLAAAKLAAEKLAAERLKSQAKRGGRKSPRERFTFLRSMIF